MRRPQTHTRRRTTPALVAAALLFACWALAACGSSGGSGGSGGSDGSGSSGGSSPAKAETKAETKEQSQEQKMETEFQEYARCLREHGLHAEVRPGGHGLKVLGNGGPAAAEAAEKACARFRPHESSKGVAPPQVKVEDEEALRKFARCMREHGVKVETSPNGGGVRIQIKPGSGQPTPESPTFKTAQSACQKLIPGGGPLG